MSASPHLVAKVAEDEDPNGAKRKGEKVGGKDKGRVPALAGRGDEFNAQQKEDNCLGREGDELEEIVDADAARLVDVLRCVMFQQHTTDHNAGRGEGEGVLSSGE